MTAIRLHNTRTRRKEPFAPLDPSHVRMYVCGPTVYDRAHLGNARPVVVFDVLFRLLRHVYGADHVRYVRNFTDVDDKINARAAATGRPIAEITEETIAWYHQDMDALGALRPTHEPRATAHIAQMIAMIERLIAKGHAYEVAGHVLFDVRSYPEYGRLSGRSVDDMIAGARVEVAPYKRDPMDFVLWKPSDPSLPGWESPWGRGRPGWHIECSAMAHELLGPSFDIHGGGIDLQFPHHENEVAQSCCAFPDGDFARYWLHNEMVQVEGKKMSKSLGNFFTVRDLLDQGWPGEVIRFVMLQTHYRKPMDWTEEKAREAMATLKKWRAYVGDAKPGKPDKIIEFNLADDLNSPSALGHLRRIAKDFAHIVRLEHFGQDNLTERGEDVKARFLASANLLGLLLPENGDWAEKSGASAEVEALMEQLLHSRQAAREAKDYARADELRDGFVRAGVLVKDTPDGPEWELTNNFDPAKLEALK